VERIDAELGAFRGRLVRDRIVEQAAFLARGDQAGYEASFGKL
jgi:predicted flap endonuclease-1-like 5' DNA nuclease